MIISCQPIQAKKQFITHLSRLITILIAACLAFPVATQTETERIEQRVLVAEQAFLNSVDRGQKALQRSLTLALNRAIEKAAQSGDLDRLESLQAELKALTEEGTLPKDAIARPYVSRFREKAVTLGDALIDRYEIALRSYTKARQIDEARLIQDKIRWIRPTEAEGYLTHEDHYYLVIQDNVTWLEAEQACLDDGGYLVCINSKQELAFVHKHAKKLNTWIWLGATDREKEGEWVWLDGSDNFWKWDSTEPNSLRGEDEDYAALFTHGVMFDWVSIKSEKVGAYICEWDHLPTRLTVYSPKDEGAEDKQGSLDE